MGKVRRNDSLPFRPRRSVAVLTVSEDTGIGPSREGFPTTRWSAVVGARSQEPAERSRSFETLIAAYWKPVYNYIRVRWNRSNEDAQDLTQGFFLRVMEKDFLVAYDPRKGRFRTFLRACLDGYLANEEKAARRLKRGGGVPALSLELPRADGELAAADIPSPDSIERYFDAEWVRVLFELAVEALRTECENDGKATYFSLFERYDLESSQPVRLTYEQLALQHGLSVSNVTNYLAYARRTFRRLLLEKLREITVTDEEFRSEARFLLGTDAP